VKVSTERLPESQVLLEIEVDDARVEKAKESAYRRLASKVKVPGFRPGKVPRNVLERHLGEDVILQEAIDRLMPEVYREALDQEAIDPIDQAAYELVTEQPLVAKFTVPIRPTVDLGDYQAVRTPREPVSIDPERVQGALEGLRHRYATYEPVARPIAWEDIIRADVFGEVGGTKLVEEEDVEFQLHEGRPISLPGFAEALIGKEKGAEFELDIPVPEDAPDEKLRGKFAHYRVRIKETKQEVLPELDDEFGRQVGEGFASLADLRKRVEADLRQGLEQEAEHQYHDEVIAALVERAKIEYPPILVEREVDRLLRDQSGIGQTAANRGSPNTQEQLERYLQRMGRSEEEMRAELRPVAEQRVLRSLVLSQVAEAEDIHVDDPEIEAEIDRLVAGVTDQADEVRRLFSSDSAKESMRRSLATRKTLERLVAIASGEEAPDEAQVSATQDG
jgi:trigger factor